MVMSQSDDSGSAPTARGTGRATPLAEPLDLDLHRTLTHGEAASRLHPLLASALARLPSGRQVFRGVPFDLGPATPSTGRWVLVDRPRSIPLDAVAASHLVVAHLCDVWRDVDGSRPEAIPPGHVTPIGQPLAVYTVEARDGRHVTRTVRRRFEVNDGILGWGSVAFASVSHLDNEPLDWRGPHDRQTPGRYAAPGQSGALTIMPGKYGGNLVGVSDLVPSASDDAFLWLWTVPLGAAFAPVALHVEPLAGGPGGDVLIAGVTLFRGTGDPLRRGPRATLLLEAGAGEPSIDLGTVIRTRRAPARPAADPTLIGWGGPHVGDEPAPDGPRLLDLDAAPDAVLDLGGWTVAPSAMRPGEPVRRPDGPAIELLPSPVIPVEVTVRDAASGQPVPARVRFTAADGRYLPPDSHRDEVNRGFLEDQGGDLILGAVEYAYVPGTFSIRLPRGRVQVEAIAGFERRPVRTVVEVGPATGRIDLVLDRVADLRADGWVQADGHVHFLAPSTALLQAAAEDVDVVNVLATQWGDLFTGISDLPWGSFAPTPGRPIVAMGTENRQNILGHLALLGARRPTLPLATAGPPEGRLGGVLEVLMADWADRCRAEGGLVVGAHFPLPYAEIAADIVTGRIDALEAQAFAPGLDDPMILEWYRYLRLGYRLPIVGGTDKMSAEVPVGAVRTYARLAPGAGLSFEAWADAVRAGRTFATSGPLLSLSVEGREPGGTVALWSPGRVAVRAVATAAQPVIGCVELVLDGRVVAATSTDAPATGLTLDEEVEVRSSGWLAARARSPYQIESVFTTSMAAHTSPVYLDVEGRPAVLPPEDAAVVEQVITGARTWVAEIAAVASADERARMTAVLDGALARLAARLRGER